MQIPAIKSKANFNEEIGKDVVCLFKYSIQPGREAEAKEYFEAAINETMSPETMSPLQQITKNPKHFGLAEVRAAPGAITVLYRFYADEIDEELRQFLLNNISRFHRV
jgi:hypothetical protein